MNFNSKSTLAKLLARENISVQHGNYRTAYFDVNARVLGLPLWKDKGKDVYDLLVGHEVGHALFTPADGWHDANAVANLPKDYLNVIEDIRIEKLIQRQYPGLVACFKRGYKSLDNEDFFGIRDKNVNALHFMNRLNLKAKLREYINVEFSDEEQPYVDRAMAVETWDDVLAVSAELHAYMKTLQSEKRVIPQIITLPSIDSQQDDYNDEEDYDPTEESGSESIQAKVETPPDAKEEDTDSVPKEDEKAETDTPASEPTSENGTAESTSGSADGSPTGSATTDDEEESPPTPSDKPVAKKKAQEETVKANEQQPADTNIEEISTDRAYRSNEGSLLDLNANGTQPLLVRALNETQVNDIIVTYETLKFARAEKAAMYDYLDSYDVTPQYREFITETTKFVGLMSKEFEMRKAAFQYSRSQTARSGSLDVTKLYNYKFSDDIFRRVTKLANSKNHGMIMLVDYSGSMHSVMPQVIKQILTLAMFCKKINIPFDVYGFTNTDAAIPRKYVTTANDINHQGLILTHQLSSLFNKRDYDLAYRQMFNQVHEVASRHYGRGPTTSVYDELGGTPLNEMLTAMPIIIERFKAKHNVEKTILTIMTDGDPQSMHVETTYEVRSVTTGFAIQMKDGVVKANKERDLTPLLVDHLRKKCGVVTLGYFLADSRYAFNGAVGRAVKSWDHAVFAAARKLVAEQKFVSYDNTIGYDKYFILRVDGKNLDTDTDEFAVADNAKASDIRRAFKKFATSKKMNRVLASQFAEAIS
jgi:hypothetical protein